MTHCGRQFPGAGKLGAYKRAQLEIYTVRVHSVMSRLGSSHTSW